MQKLASVAVDFVQYNDYYPYGSILKSGGAESYRYDYQGQFAEKDQARGDNHF